MTWDLSSLDLAALKNIGEGFGEIAWELDGGDFVDGAPPYNRYVVGRENELPLPSAVEKLGCEFVNWTIGGVPVTSIPADATGLVTVKANWRIAYHPTEKIADTYATLSETLIINNDDIIDGDINTSIDLIKLTSNWRKEIKLPIADELLDKVYVRDFDTTNYIKIQTINYTSKYRRLLNSDYVFEYNGSRTAFNTTDIIKESGLRADVWYNSSIDKYSVRLYNGENKVFVYSRKYASADVEYHAIWDITAVNDSKLEYYVPEYEVIYYKSKNSSVELKRVRVPYFKTYTFESLSEFTPAGYILCYFAEKTNSIPIYKVSPLTRTTNLEVYPVWQRNIFSIGDTVTFGKYPQSSTDVNVKEPIEWTVLDINKKPFFWIGMVL